MKRQKKKKSVKLDVPRKQYKCFFNDECMANHPWLASNKEDLCLPNANPMTGILVL